jgi:hypothetical protein
MLIKRVNRQRLNAEVATALPGDLRSAAKPMLEAAVLANTTLDGTERCKQATSEVHDVAAHSECIDGPASHSFVSNAALSCRNLVCGSHIFVPWAQPDVMNSIDTASEINAILSSLMLTNSAIAALSPMLAEEGVLSRFCM